MVILIEYTLKNKYEKQSENEVFKILVDAIGESAGWLFKSMRITKEGD